MTISLTCKRCGTTISAEDTDGLVTDVQNHVAEHGRKHGRHHIPTREQILARLDRAQRRGATATPNQTQPRPAPSDRSAAETEHGADE
jgi:hypothetical protein